MPAPPLPGFENRKPIYEINKYYVMNYSINSFTGASEAPACGGYVLVICKKNEFSCAFSLFLGFKMNIFQKLKHQSYSTS